MTGALSRWLVAWLLVVGVVAGWAADPRVLVVREGTAVAKQAGELLAAELRQSGWIAEETVVADDAAPALADSVQAVVAFGARACLRAPKRTGGQPLVCALLTQAAVDDMPPAGDRWSAILLDQPADRWASLLHLAFPTQSRVGLLVGPAGQKALQALERRLADRRVSLATEAVRSAEDLVPALERLIPRMQLLLALPDPAVHNRNTVQPLLLTTYRAAIPVVAYSEAYQQAGAALALYSTVPQIVAQVAETLRALREGMTPPAVQSPRYYTVGMNGAVARSLGLRLPPASELLERLRTLEP